MKLRKKQSTPPKGAPGWMVTYSDLFTLILVFFILLFSMSQIDMMKFKTIAESFKDNDNNESGVPLGKQKGQTNGTNEDQSLQNFLTEVQGYLEDSSLKDAIVANRTERGVVLVLQEQVLFKSGKAEIIDGSNGFLVKVGELLRTMSNMIKVEGHTDNRPISTYRYPSNWDLSSARASSVIRYFIDHFNLEQNRFVAVGYGETRPIVPNNGPENWKKNRRVEIVIVDPRFQEQNENP